MRSVAFIWAVALVGMLLVSCAGDVTGGDQDSSSSTGTGALQTQPGATLESENDD